MWRPIATAPKDGTMILGCSPGPWKEHWQQWQAPKTIAFRSFHPNQPGKTEWRDAQGHPAACTHWMPLPEPPVIGLDKGA